MSQEYEYLSSDEVSNIENLLVQANYGERLHDEQILPERDGIETLMSINRKRELKIQILVTHQELEFKQTIHHIEEMLDNFFRSDGYFEKEDKGSEVYYKCQIDLDTELPRTGASR